MIVYYNFQDGSCVLEKLNSTNFNLMGNFLCSEGKPGKVNNILIFFYVHRVEAEFTTES